MMPSNTRMSTIQFNPNGVSQNRQPLNWVGVGGGRRLQENSQKKCRRTSTLINAGPRGTLITPGLWCFVVVCQRGSKKNGPTTIYGLKAGEPLFQIIHLNFSTVQAIDFLQGVGPFV